MAQLALTKLNGRLRIDSVTSKLVMNEKTPGAPCCCCPLQDIELEYAAGPQDGHQCDLALFNLYLYAEGANAHKVNIGDVNLNNGSTGAEMVVKKTVNTSQANDITKDADDCCILYAQLECAYGTGACHSNLARLKVTIISTGRLIFNGRAGESPVRLDICKTT